MAAANRHDGNRWDALIERLQDDRLGQLSVARRRYRDIKRTDILVGHPPGKVMDLQGRCAVEWSRAIHSASLKDRWVQG